MCRSLVDEVGPECSTQRCRWEAFYFENTKERTTRSWLEKFGKTERKKMLTRGDSALQPWSSLPHDLHNSTSVNLFNSKLYSNLPVPPDKLHCFYIKGPFLMHYISVCFVVCFMLYLWYFIFYIVSVRRPWALWKVLQQIKHIIIIIIITRHIETHATQNETTTTWPQTLVRKQLFIQEWVGTQNTGENNQGQDWQRDTGENQKRRGNMR